MQNISREIHQSIEPRQYTSEDDPFNQPLTTIEETLEEYGMLKNEIKVYLHLAESGLKKANDICNAVNIHRTETYRLLRNLSKKGLVFSVLEKPVKFCAVSLNEAIDLLVEAQKTRLQMLENQKDALLWLWNSRPQKKYEPAKKEVFQKLEGERQIILKANELVERTENEFRVFVSDEYLPELYFGGFFERLKAQKDNLAITLLTVCSQKSTYFLDKIKWPHNMHRLVEAQELPCFIISDNQELLVAFTEGEPSNELGHKKKLKTTAVWTNYPAVVSAFEVLFRIL